jgi:phage repressor protein C with HTH and peptisase S24 domain
MVERAHLRSIAHFALERKAFLLGDLVCAFAHSTRMNRPYDMPLDEQAERTLPIVEGRSQEEVRLWVRGLARLTDWSPSQLATQAGLAASTLNRFLNAPVKHNLSTTTINKLRAAAKRRVAQRIATGEIEPGEARDRQSARYPSPSAEALRPALASLPELVKDRAAVQALRRFVAADRRRADALATLLSGRLAAPRAAAPVREEEEYVLVPVYDVAAAAGDGTIVDDDHITGRLAFMPSWLQRVSNAAPDDLAVITVRGDSMEHTLKHDDTVLVDFTQRRPRRDGIFVIRYDDAVQVKRVSIHPVSKRLTVQSDNRDYPSYADLGPDDVDIVGRVIWLGRQV